MADTGAATRKAMIRALQALVVPMLRARGFSGSFPHFQRSEGGRVHLWSFHFSKWGGSFIVELGRCEAAADGSRPTIASLPLEDRARLQANVDGRTEAWFDYRRTWAFWRNASRPARAAAAVAARLPDAQAWFEDGVARGAVQAFVAPRADAG